MLIMLMRTVEAEAALSDVRESERGITESGRGDAAYAAVFMKALGLEPKLILSSPFRRARETAETVSSNLPDRPPVQIAPAILPGAGVDEILRAIRSRADCGEDEWLLAVCHEPDISLCLREMLGCGGECRIPIDFGTVVGLDLQCGEGRVCGKLIFLFSPMAMRS